MHENRYKCLIIWQPKAPDISLEDGGRLDRSPTEESWGDD